MISSRDPSFINLITQTLESLVGGQAPLSYRSEPIPVLSALPLVGSRMNWPYWTVVNVGTGAGTHPNAWTLVTRIMAHARLVSIRQGNTTEAKPVVSWYEKQRAGFLRLSQGAVDVDVWIDPQDLTQNTFPRDTLTEDLTGGEDQVEQAPAEIVLGHELAHADRWIRGQGAQTFNNQGNPISGTYTYGGGTTPRISLEEIYNIGLNPHGTTPANPDLLAVTENMLRGERNLGERRAYQWGEVD